MIPLTVTNNDISVKTPLIFSKPLSDIISRDVYLKLENTQPSGSFKLRGLSHLCKQKVKEGCTKFVGSSGGNAGLALAYSANVLNVPCQIFVPQYVARRMLNKIRAYGADVVISGNDWQEANDKALDQVAKDSTVAYVHPFDHPYIWEGHSKMVEEIKEDLQGKKPSCIVASVGGGGLLLGILQGLENAGWTDVPVLTMETIGADCFNLSIKENKIVEIQLTSIAKTLGARSVAPYLMERHSKFRIISEVLPDKDAVMGCINLADDHGFLVEPSCGVTMASVYSKVLPGALEKQGINTLDGPIVLIVCGGSDVTPEILTEFMEMFKDKK